MKTSELTGAALDWAVAQCEGFGVNVHAGSALTIRGDGDWWNPSTDWAQGGPIIERKKIEWQWLPSPNKTHQYGARKPSLGGLNRTFCMDGPTILVAAMRCYVASVLGDDVEIPATLLETV